MIRRCVVVWFKVRVEFRVMKHEDTKGTKKHEEELSYVIIGAALEVHRTLGPGLLESAYEACLSHELRLRGVPIRRQTPLPLVYKGVHLKCAYRIDLLVEDLIVVEFKVVEHIPPVATSQLLTLLRLLNCRLGLIVNFYEPILRAGIRRVVNG